MKYLLIPDVHNRWELVEKIIKHVNADKIILLGDYFDDFDDDPHIIIDVVDWFHHSVNQKNRVHIVGNHDLHYWFKDNKNVRCAGYDQFKSIAINDIVTEDDWKKLVFFYNLDGKWLLTHAGLHPSWIKPDKFRKKENFTFSVEKASKLIGDQVESFLVATGRNKWHWFDMPGYSRCRNSPYYGGIVWCDWNGEFWPTRGLHQIVGHTPNDQLSWKFLKDNDPVTHTAGLGVVPKLSEKTSYNICLDSKPGSSYYAIYEDSDEGLLTIHESKSIQ